MAKLLIALFFLAPIVVAILHALVASHLPLAPAGVVTVSHFPQLR